MYIYIMIHFQLPRNNPNLFKYVDISLTDSVPVPVISNSLSFFLNSMSFECDACQRKQLAFLSHFFYDNNVQAKF